MNISTSYSLLVNYTRAITNKKFVKVYTDDKLIGSVLAVTGYFYNDSSQKIEKVVDLTYTT